jgi:hypothetical protein
MRWKLFTTLATLALLPATGRAATPLPSGTEIHVNVSAHGLHYNPSAAVFPDGGFVVVWTNGPASGGHAVIHARLFAANGSPTSGEFRLTEPAAGSQYADQVVADRDGSFLVAWSEERGPGGPTDVFVRRFGRDGTPGKQILVDEDRSLVHFRGRLAVGADGRFAVAWTALHFRSFSYEDAMARVFHADGTPAGEEIVVAHGDPGIGDDSTEESSSAVALEPDGSLSVLYGQFFVPDEHQVILVHYSLRGGVTARVRLNGLGHDVDDRSSLALAPDGSLVAAWSEDSEVSAARLTMRGVRRGDSFLLDNRFVGQQTVPALAALPDGGFVAVWVEQNRDGDGSGVFGRVFAADGTPLTRDLRMNVTTAGNQDSPAISANRRGPVVVVWQQDEINIFARLLTSR